ncbi:c-type cytochrome [Piscinibacter koreensis]|uniref:C-type cytochrome n=1 Tax=Piscinibacter koreensis TaxID=2742824 RepID=A0A7Y6NSA8_9BURK|nr:c-type cytochrome [Schlegelella koreensis]NUZ08414.1 c-type cytochrome [Schlegelella koreensis]
MKHLFVLVSTFGLSISHSAVWAAGDAARGAAFFQQCAACHSTTAGEHLTGPSLANVWERKAGTVADFHRYSDALKRATFVWNAKTLDKWLTDPEAFIPGTSMTFPGLRDSNARQDVIAYIKAISEGKAPTLAQRGGGMMMNMQTAHADLKAAPAEGQVTAIKHCADTYTVSTADGKNNKVWEFNLRFKTDSSRLGPTPGKPVIVGAGMQGDRASVVFAAPGEISRFIKEGCL